MAFTWAFPEVPAPEWQNAAQNLCENLQIPPLIANFLVRRGIASLDEARRFLEPALADLQDAHALPDVQKAVDRLFQAIERGEKIFVHGDYDADGITSAALCLRALTVLGAKVTGYVPKRSDGYDLQAGGVDKAHALGAGLILTADCGVCAIEPIAYAKSLGIDVIVTDHHRPSAVLPDAVAVVNPYRTDCPAPPFKDLCGAGVAFKVMDALFAHLQPSLQIAFRNNFVDLAALGTVADMTPLCGENRIIVAHGLRVLGEGKKTGLRALLSSCKLMGRTLNADNIGFGIGPRLNAAGRMGDADLAYRLLITKDADEAQALTSQIEDLAQKSRDETARVTHEAMEDALSPMHENRRVLVLARPKWGKGVVGVAAGRIVEARRRPVIMLSYDKENDLYHGSARTWGDWSIHNALHECGDLLARWGGHSAAAGLSLPAQNLEAFRDKMHDLAPDLLDETGEAVLPILPIDAKIDDASLLNLPLTEWVQRLGPFGRGNAEPVFATLSATLTGIRRVGKDGGTCQMHLRLPGATEPMKGFAFRNGDWADEFYPGDRVDVAYTPVINEWNGRVNVELSVKDLRASE